MDAVGLFGDPKLNQRRGDDNENVICVFEGRGIVGRERNHPKMLFFLGSAMTTEF